VKTNEIVTAGSLTLQGDPGGVGLGQPGEDISLRVSNSILWCLQGRHQWNRSRLFTVMNGRRNKDHMHKLKEERFRLNRRDIFSSCGQPSRRRLPRSVVSVSILRDLQDPKALSLV